MPTSRPPFPTDDQAELMAALDPHRPRTTKDLKERNPQFAKRNLPRDLAKLELVGYVKSSDVEHDPGLGGLTRGQYTITPGGIAALKQYDAFQINVVRKYKAVPVVRAAVAGLSALLIASPAFASTCAPRSLRDILAPSSDISRWSHVGSVGRQSGTVPNAPNNHVNDVWQELRAQHGVESRTFRDWLVAEGTTVRGDGSYTLAYGDVATGSVVVIDRASGRTIDARRATAETRALGLDDSPRTFVFVDDQPRTLPGSYDGAPIERYSGRFEPVAACEPNPEKQAFWQAVFYGCLLAVAALVLHGWRSLIAHLRFANKHRKWAVKEYIEDDGLSLPVAHVKAIGSVFVSIAVEPLKLFSVANLRHRIGL